MFEYFFYISLDVTMKTFIRFFILESNYRILPFLKFFFRLFNIIQYFEFKITFYHFSTSFPIHLSRRMHTTPLPL